MGTKDDQFFEKLMAAFRMEADEHLRAIINGLLELEKSSDEDGRATMIENMYREAHSLKGASRSVNMTLIEAVCQAVESVFSGLKAKRIQGSTDLFDALHRAADIMVELLGEPEGVAIQPIVDELERFESGAAASSPRRGGPRKKAARKGASREKYSKGQVTPEVSSQAEPEALVADSSLEAAESKASQAGPPVETVPRETAESDRGAVRGAENVLSGSPVKDRLLQSDTVRISVDKLDPLMRQVGEMVLVKLTSRRRVEDLMRVMSAIDLWKQKWASLSSHGKGAGALLNLRGRSGESAGADGELAKLMDFLDWNESCVKSLELKLKELAKSAEAEARLHGGMVDDLLEDMMNVLMLPCSSLLEMFPKLARDLSREAGKEVNLEIRGGDLEIDRRILDEMKDPLIHLVRNAIDHGIEAVGERESMGKPRVGTLTIAISQVSGNQIELVVSDDGAGIDAARVREAARRRGMLSEQEKDRLDGQDALSLVFRSEVSTSPVVTNISGRGLGLAIVREKVENLGGSVSVATAPQIGASFKIVLPVTLSTFRGTLVNACDQLFIIPTSNVERVARIKKDVVKTVGNRDTIEVNGRAVPLIRLGDVLGLQRSAKKVEDTEYIPVLILRSAETLFSFSVETILQEQEVLVKTLGKQLSRVRNVAGATVLGSGKLVPILNVPDLIKSASKGARGGIGPAIRVEELESRTKSVLVVEDSITSRMLLKNILESSGYKVTTSVDGVEAWNVLKKDPFDLVVSDVEMPRMDGFELTSNIRGDERLSEIPVVLVTSLGSREDRERGIEVGANAYIVKGSFDQNNLLETVERLV